MILVATGLRREAQIIARAGLTVIACGGHGAALAARLDDAIVRARPDGLLSIGIAGALDPAMQVGDVVVDGDADWLASLFAVARSGFGIAAAAAPVATVAAKTALRTATGAAAVDMETHIVASVARAHGLRWAALRVISDGAARDLPSAAQVALSPDGGVRLGAVLAALRRDPGQLGALLALARDTRRALAELATLMASFVGPAR